MKHASRVIKPFEYATAARTAEPGYLEEKFRQVRRRLQQQQRAAEAMAEQVRAERERVVRKLAKVA